MLQKTSPPISDLSCSSSRPQLGRKPQHWVCGALGQHQLLHESCQHPQTIGPQVPKRTLCNVAFYSASDPKPTSSQNTWAVYIRHSFPLRRSFSPPGVLPSSCNFAALKGIHTQKMSHTRDVGRLGELRLQSWHPLVGKGISSLNPASAHLCKGFKKRGALGCVQLMGESWKRSNQSLEHPGTCCH